MAQSIEVTYTGEHWDLLESLRDEAIRMLQPLHSRHIEAHAYGSIARGDVHAGSDIDIHLPNPPAPAVIEILIEEAAPITHREIVQSTPTYAAKAYIHTAETRSYSLPLVTMRPHEREFYQFAGTVDHDQIMESARVPGVDKKLNLIQPTRDGHTETPIQGREGTTAKTLGVGITTVLDRVRTLNRRERIGRTGVYIQRTLHPDESFGDVYRQLARKRPPLRRRLRT